MKIKYTFATETVEIEVTDEWAAVLIDMDRQEHNNNQTETRRHCSLDALNLDDAYLPSDVDLERDVLANVEKTALLDAIQKLQPQQQELIRRVYFGEEKLSDIAREEGVSKMAITNRMRKIMASLKKILS